jgi:hypothetical protein
MAQFYAEIDGNRGPASRTGTKNSGMTGHIRGWKVGCRVNCYHDEETDRDEIHVYRTGGSGGDGQSDRLIAVLIEGKATRRKR